LNIGGCLGDHCLLRHGYGSIAQALTQDVDLRLNTVVTRIEYHNAVFPNSNGKRGVRVHTQSGEVFEGDVALVTLPLGVLKKGYDVCLVLSLLEYYLIQLFCAAFQSCSF
jgi:hypothetical protein